MSQSQVEVKLNQAEEAAVLSLPSEFQAAARTEMLRKKGERMAKVISNRKDFSATVNENGNIVVRGLGNRWPMGFRPDSLEILLSKASELQAVIAQAKQHPANTK